MLGGSEGGVAEPHEIAEYQSFHVTHAGLTSSPLIG